MGGKDRFVRFTPIDPACESYWLRADDIYVVTQHNDRGRLFTAITVERPQSITTYYVKEAAEQVVREVG